MLAQNVRVFGALFLHLGGKNGLTIQTYATSPILCRIRTFSHFSLSDGISVVFDSGTLDA